MNKRLKIGIVGCGAIGTSLAKAIVRDFKQKAELTGLFDIVPVKTEALSKSISTNRRLVTTSIGQLISKANLIIECASAKSCWDITQAVLRKKRDIMIMSVGGIISNYRKLWLLAKKTGSKVYIPSGAISGLDGLKAARLGKIKSVTLITTKNPKSFSAVPYLIKKKISIDGIKEDTVIFYSSAKEAVSSFPQNINVAGLLSIAGIGADRTKVKIIASPATEKNIHEVRIESDVAKISTRTENVPHPNNPKTSYLAVLAAIATLKGIFDPVKIGT